MKLLNVLLSSVFVLTAGPGTAQELALTPAKPECVVEEPDPVQISWMTPCETGTWLYEPGIGCRMWDWHPDPQDKASWSGTCVGALKEGPGVLQWTEHGQPIDRFVGTYRGGRRQGPGRYDWNATDYFVGNYANDLPNGFGIVSLAGTTLSTSPCRLRIGQVTRPMWLIESYRSRSASRIGSQG